MLQLDLPATHHAARDRCETRERGTAKRQSAAWKTSTPRNNRVPRILGAVPCLRNRDALAQPALSPGGTCNRASHGRASKRCCATACSSASTPTREPACSMVLLRSFPGSYWLHRRIKLISQLGRWLLSQTSPHPIRVLGISGMPKDHCHRQAILATRFTIKQCEQACLIRSDRTGRCVIVRNRSMYKPLY